MNSCNAELHIADDYGDYKAMMKCQLDYKVMKCQLEDGHEGPHRESFDRDGTPVVVTWHVDERSKP